MTAKAFLALFEQEEKKGWDELAAMEQLGL